MESRLAPLEYILWLLLNHSAECNALLTPNTLNIRIIAACQIPEIATEEEISLVNCGRAFELKHAN
jgi:hypothetical protein